VIGWFVKHAKEIKSGCASAIGFRRTTFLPTSGRKRKLVKALCVAELRITLAHSKLA